MRQAFAEYAGALPVESGARAETLEDVEQAMAARGLAAIRIGVRDSLPSNVSLYQSLGYELLSIDPHPRGPDRVWTMKKWITT